MIDKHKKFTEVFNKHLNRDKEAMISYENAISDDYKIKDINLINVSSSAEASLESFWATFLLDLQMVDEYGNIVKLIDTKYYLRTRSSAIEFIQSSMESPYSYIWNLPKEVEKSLIVAMLADMISMDELCLMSLTMGIIEYMVEEDYIHLDMFDDESKIIYYEHFDNTIFLPKVVQDIFIF